MYLTKRNIKYADLLVPFSKCPFEEVESDCPFVEYWNFSSEEEQIVAMSNLPESKLNILRAHHQKCLERKMKENRRLSNRTETSSQ